MSHDPLIHGPVLNESRTTRPALHASALDLENSSPAQDFVALIRNPARLFESIPLDPSPLLVCKALVGAVTLVMLARFASAGFRLESGFGAIEKILPQLEMSGVEF